MNALVLLFSMAFAADLDDSAAAAWHADPQLGRAVFAAEPRTTRAPGILRFTDALTADPAAAVFIADRLRKEDDPAVRRALVERLGRHDPSNGEWLVDQLAVEPDPIVRSAIVATLTEADAEYAAKGLELAAKDADPSVRAEAEITRRLRQSE